MSKTGGGGVETMYRFNNRHLTVENKYVESLGNFGGPFWGRKFIAKKCVSLEVYQ